MKILNPDVLKAFRDIMDVSQYKALFSLASAELGKNSFLLKAQLLNLEWKKVEFMLHKMKGSMGSLGCDLLFHKMNILEKQLNSLQITVPNEDQIGTLLETLDLTLQALRAEAN